MYLHVLVLVSLFRLLYLYLVVGEYLGKVGRRRGEEKEEDSAGRR